MTHGDLHDGCRQKHHTMKQTPNHKRSATIGCLALLIGLAVMITILASTYLLNYALKPEGNKGHDYDGQYTAMKTNYPWISQWVDSLQEAKALRDTFITVKGGDRRFFAADSTRLHALLVKAPSQTSRTAVLVPGYTDCAINMLHAGFIYGHVLGMNLLIPDLRANGKSQGEAMQMGWKDADDVMMWINVAENTFRDSTGNASIVVHGQSMGAATTMNLSGKDTPASVKCFVEDCGYSSVWDEFSHEIGEEFGLPDFPLLHSASALCKLKYGWSFGEASPLRQVAKCGKPMLFIHGGADTFVPTRMVFPLYAAKPAPKYLKVFHGSSHAHSYRDHRHEYERTIKAFIEKHL